MPVLGGQEARPVGGEQVRGWSPHKGIGTVLSGDQRGAPLPPGKTRQEDSPRHMSLTLIMNVNLTMIVNLVKSQT